jgi:hypothetical protein
VWSSGALRGSGARPPLFTLGALLLSIAVWLVLGTGIGQPVRAMSVLLFLGGPALLVSRFVPGPTALERAVVGLACGAGFWAVIAWATLAARAWTATSALLTVSVVVGLVAALDLVWSWRAQSRGLPS